MLRRILLTALALMALTLPAAAQPGPALVFDPVKGIILYEEDMDALWHPASLTKLMTAYLVFHALKDGKFTMDDNVVCSEHASKQPPSKIGLPVGGEMRVELALKSLIVKSANDVAVMLGEKVAGSDEAFVRLMNETARKLGMQRTKFYNTHGLPHDGQVTSARDMALLARAIITEFPEHAHLFALQSVKIGKRTLRTHNRLLKNYEGADGMKTGFVCASGYNVVASATRDGRRLVAVVFGGRTGRARNERAAELLDHAFRRYNWKTVFAHKIDEVAVQASLTDGPPNLRSRVCVYRKPARKKRKRAAKKRSRKKE